MGAFGQKIGTWARAHTDCSVLKNKELYLESVAPPADRVQGAGLRYMMAGPSTCALYGCRALADGGGLTDEEITEDYTLEIGTAVANVQIVAARHLALERLVAFGTAAKAGEHTLPVDPFLEGDIVIINGPPWGVHVIVCTGDVAVSADGQTWTGPTCQGGQANGGVESFASTWHVRPDALGQLRLFAGSGARYVVQIVRASAFDPIVDPSGTADDTTDVHNAETLPGA
jgi:hypothetical protein